MSKQVYLVRHGESRDGEAAVYQADASELSVAGVEQAEILSRRFKAIPIDTIYTSPLPRARQTADIIRRVLPSAHIVTNELLRELKRPSQIIGMPLHEPAALKIKNELKEHMHDPAWHHSDEENFYDVRSRVRSFLDILERESSEHILVVSHAMILRILAMVMVFGRDADHTIHDILYHHFRMTQTGVTLFEYTGKGWLLMTWNDYAHLGEDTTEHFYRSRQDI